MSEKNKKYKLITRSDFDGLVCGLLFMHLEMINDIVFVHPKDMQDGMIAVSENDISTNLPYVEGIHMAFDHHISETVRLKGKRENHIIDPNAPSAARVVYDYYGGQDKFPHISDEMMAAVDKADSAQFSLEDILEPKGWDLLSFIMDARTGLGRFRNFRIPNTQLMLDLILHTGVYSIDDILQLPDVVERVELYNSHKELAKKQIRKCSRVYSNLVVLDLKNEETIYSTNRFMIYALYPNCNISIHVLWGKQKQNTVFAVGKSIIKRDCKTNIGELMLKYGGGGHANAGTCQVDHYKANQVLEELIAQIAE